MGHYYRERHETPATTTSDDIAGITGTAQADDEWALEDVTLQELRDQAEALGLKTYGTKADIAKRISELENA